MSKSLDVRRIGGTVLTMFDEEGFWVGSVEFGRIKSQLLLKACRNNFVFVNSKQNSIVFPGLL